MPVPPPATCDSGRATATLSPSLVTYSKRCLHKDPKQRIPDIAAMRLALGALLDETATGHRPFVGDSAASVIGAILKDTPPALSSRQPLTPPILEHIVSRCLAKDPDERCQSARDLRDELAWVAGAGVSQTSATPPRPSAARTAALAWVLTALASVVAAGAVVLYLRAPVPDTRPNWFAIPPPAKQMPEQVELSVSPDGRQVAFFAPDADGIVRLWVRAFDSPAARALPGTEGANPGSGAAAWSPDGSALAFFARGKLLRVDLAGGAPLVLADAPGTSRGVSWGSRGALVFVPASAVGVYRVSAGGGTAERLLLSRLSQAAEYPSFLPDGRHFRFDTQTSLSGNGEA